MRRSSQQRPPLPPACSGSPAPPGARAGLSLIKPLCVGADGLAAAPLGICETRLDRPVDADEPLCLATSCSVMRDACLMWVFVCPRGTHEYAAPGPGLPSSGSFSAGVLYIILRTGWRVIGVVHLFGVGDLIRNSQPSSWQSLVEVLRLIAERVVDRGGWCR